MLLVYIAIIAISFLLGLTAANFCMLLRKRREREERRP